MPGGSTGEFTTLTNAERRQLIEVTVEAAAGRVPVVAGTGALSTRETVELSVHAEQAGAAAVMIIPPFYDAPAWRELLAHYTAVADAISIPIMYYNMPGVSGVTLSAEQLRELPVTCLKDTGGDATAATELIQTDGPTLLNGYDTHTFHALAAGVEAVVWGTASIIPEQCVELHRLLIDDIDLPAARELWARIWPLCQFLESQSYSAAVKAACRARRRHHRPGPRAAARARRGGDRELAVAGRSRAARRSRAVSTCRPAAARGGGRRHCDPLRVRRRERERQRLVVAAGAQPLRRADVLPERDRHRVVGHRLRSTPPSRTRPAAAPRA